MKEQEVLLPKFHYAYEMLQQGHAGLSKMFKSRTKSPLAQVLYKILQARVFLAETKMDFSLPRAALIPSITSRILSSSFVYDRGSVADACVLFAQVALPHSECRVNVCCVNVVPGTDSWLHTVASTLPFV